MHRAAILLFGLGVSLPACSDDSDVSGCHPAECDDPGEIAPCGYSQCPDLPAECGGQYLTCFEGCIVEHPCPPIDAGVSAYSSPLPSSSSGSAPP